MNNTNTSVPFKPILLSLIFILLSIVGFAQSLPKIQIGSLRAPGNIKIDGIATEWGNKFQAYNRNVQAYYTIANDDNNLYLLIQATDPLIIRKIIAGSITFTTRLSGKKDINNTVAITYPIFDKTNWPTLNLKDIPIVTKNSTISIKQVDSFMRVVNGKLTRSLKEIKITGVKSLDDTLVSIYNSFGIKASSLFYNKINYTYELAIPLKYLGLSINYPSSFSYNIQFNGSATAEGSIIEHIEGGTRVRGSASIPDMMVISHATDFTGSYILAKK
jgi:hypothetical protein